MKIAVFTDLYLEIAGGIPSSISAQKRELEKLGHEVVVFCPGRTKPHEKNVVLLPTSKFIKINGAPTAKWPGKIVDFIDKNYPNFKQNFDLIHAHYEAGASIAAVLLAKKYNMPLVQTMHGREDMAIAVNVPHPFKTIAGWSLNHIHAAYLKKYTKAPKIKRDNYLANMICKQNMWQLMARQANSADQVITPSQHFAEKLAKYGVSKPITAVSNGVSDEIVSSRSWRVRTLESAQNEPLRIISTCRLSREKRILPFLEALNLVNQQKPGSFRYTIVGDGNDAETARKLAKSYRIDTFCDFKGAIPHEKVMNMLENQHISITNSYGFDTQGLTLLEASATGLPVLYCDPDMDKVVVKGAAIRPKDETPEEMAKTILDILDHPEKITEMSQNAFKNRVSVLQSSQIKKLLSVYELAISKNRSSNL